MNANQRNRACFYIYMYPQSAYASTGKLVYVSSLYAQVEFLPAVFFTSNNNQPTVLAYYRLSCVCVCVCVEGGGGGCMASERASVSPKWIDFEVTINWQSRKCDNNPWKSKFSRARLKTPACKLNSDERLSLFLNLWLLNLPKSAIKQELKGSDSGSLSRKSSKQDVL